MKKSVGSLGMIVLAMLAVGSLALAQQVGHISTAPGTSENNHASVFASNKCCETDCCKADCCKGNCGKADCCKEDCCKEDDCKSSGSSGKDCSMKSDSTKQCGKAMMHGAGKSEKGCCAGMKHDGCKEKMMEKKSEHRSGKAKTSKELKSPEPRKADK